MNRKILMILALMIVGVAAISAVSASMVEVNTLNFTLPDGYEPSQATTNNTTAMGLYYKGDDVIMIMVMKNDTSIFEDTSSDADHYVNKTISGHDGVFNNGTEKILGTKNAAFVYVDDNNNTVFVMAKDESMIQSILA